MYILIDTSDDLNTHNQPYPLGAVHKSRYGHFLDLTLPSVTVPLRFLGKNFYPPLVTVFILLYPVTFLNFAFVVPPSRHVFVFLSSPPFTDEMVLISNLLPISIVILYITIDYQNRKEIFYKISKTV